MNGVRMRMIGMVRRYDRCSHSDSTIYPTPFAYIIDAGLDREQRIFGRRASKPLLPDLVQHELSSVIVLAWSPSRARSS